MRRAISTLVMLSFFIACCTCHATAVRSLFDAGR
jgi:hypothetical protein